MEKRVLTEEQFLNFLESCNYSFSGYTEKGENEGEIILFLHTEESLNALHNKEEIDMEIETLNQWFDFYDVQVSQALRCERLGLVYSGSYGETVYNSLEELDFEALSKSARLKELSE